MQVNTPTEKFMKIMEAQKRIPTDQYCGWLLHGCRVILESVNQDTLSFEILNLTPELGTGRGSRALQTICQIADQTRVTLSGVIVPFNDKPLTLEQLRSWYARHGFTTVEGNHIERLPFGWIAIILKNFSEPWSTRTTAVRVQASQIPGCIRVGDHDLFNAGREIFETEDEALSAGERDLDLQRIAWEADWMKFDEWAEQSDGLRDRVQTSLTAGHDEISVQ
jgi:hypothetical protein